MKNQPWQPQHERALARNSAVYLHSHCDGSFLYSFVALRMRSLQTYQTSETRKGNVKFETCSECLFSKLRQMFYSKDQEFLKSQRSTLVKNVKINSTHNQNNAVKHFFHGCFGSMSQNISFVSGGTHYNIYRQTLR